MIPFLCIPCLALILYFLILGLFFPKYRPFIKEGWRCFVDKLFRRKCSISFDNRMRLALSSWLAKKGFVRLGKLMYKEKNFNRTLIMVMILFTIISILLFILLIKFLIASPCQAGDSCSI